MAPTGHPPSERTAGLWRDRIHVSVVRLHGHSDKWAGKDIEERFGYLYSGAEPDDRAGRIAGLAETAKSTYVLTNNCCADNSQRNAARLMELLAARGADVAPPGPAP